MSRGVMKLIFIGKLGHQAENYGSQVMKRPGTEQEEKKKQIKNTIGVTGELRRDQKAL